MKKFEKALDKIEMIIRNEINPDIKKNPELRDEVIKKIKVYLRGKE